jgi:hypothetical protein
MCLTTGGDPRLFHGVVHGQRDLDPIRRRAGAIRPRGRIVTLDRQDRGLWGRREIAEGVRVLATSPNWTYVTAGQPTRALAATSYLDRECDVILDRGEPSVGPWRVMSLVEFAPLVLDAIVRWWIGHGGRGRWTDCQREDDIGTPSCRDGGEFGRGAHRRHRVVALRLCRSALMVRSRLRAIPRC